MFIKISRMSAILLLISAVLLVGFLVMLPNLQFQDSEKEDMLGFAIAMVILGLPLTYGASVIFTIIALILGILLLTKKTRKKLVGLNIGALVVSLVLLPAFAFALYIVGQLLVNSQLGAFPILYTILVALVYLMGIVTQIVTIARLKKAPEESVSPVAE